MDLFIKYHYVNILIKVATFFGSLVITYIFSKYGNPITYDDFNYSQHMIIPYEYILLEECTFRCILYDNNYKYWILNSFFVGYLYYIHTHNNVLVFWNCFMTSLGSNLYLGLGNGDFTILVWSRLFFTFVYNFFIF